MTKLYCDTSNLNEIRNCLKKFDVRGVTTNPSIMRKEGVKNYKLHCKKILKLTKGKPLSVEVFADKEEEIIDQAYKISKWSKSIYVKVPVINTNGIFLGKAIKKLNSSKIKKWYCQNRLIDHRKLFSIPIGIANSQWGHGDFDTIAKIRDEKNSKCETKTSIARKVAQSLGVNCNRKLVQSVLTHRRSSKLDKLNALSFSGTIGL